MNRALFLLLIVSTLLTTKAWAWHLQGRLSHRGKRLPAVTCTLFVEGEEIATTISNNKGLFSFKDIKEESIKLSFRKDGFFPASRSIMNFSGSNTSTSVSLKKRQQWSLSGKVLNLRQEPIEAALLTFKKTDGPRSNREIIGSCYTDSKGHFQFNELCDTACSFTVEASGYQGRFIWKRNAEQLDLEMEIKVLDTKRQHQRVKLYPSPSPLQ